MLRRRTSYVWNHIPLLRPVAPFLLGLLIGLNMPLHVGQYWFYAFLILAWLLLIGVERWKQYFAFTSTLLFLLLGLGFGDAHQSAHAGFVSEWVGQQECYRAKVLERGRSTKRSIRTILQFTHRIGVDRIEPIDDLQVLTYLEKDSALLGLKAGQMMTISTVLHPLRKESNPFAFDYAEYLAKQGIYHRAYIGANAFVLLGEERGFLEAIAQWQGALIDVFMRADIPEDVKGLLIALVLGDKGSLTNNQRAAFAEAGAMHVLAVSGLHVGIIYLIISSFLFFLGKRSQGRWIRVFIIITTLWLYAGITGFSPSVTRAATMFTFVVIGASGSRRSGVYHALLGSAMLLLVIQPGLLVEVGFQLSYAAVFGIVSLQPLIYGWFKKSRWWLVDKLWALTSVSLAAQIATFPLALYYFHQFPLYFLLSNLLVIPLATILLPTGLSYLLLSKLTFASDAIEWLLRVLGICMHRGIEWIVALPNAALDGFYIGIFELYLMYALVFGIVFFFMTKRPFWFGYSMICSIVIITVDLHALWMQSKTRSIWFYRSSGGDVMSYIHGNRLKTIGSASFWDSDYDLNAVTSHWDAMGIEPSNMEAMELSENYYVIGGLWVLHPTKAMSLTQRTTADLIWVTETLTDHEGLIQNTEPRWVVLSAQLSYDERRVWKDLLKQRTIHLIDLSEAAPFELCLSSEGLCEGEAVF
jgi:competence protein ComEC